LGRLRRSPRLLAGFEGLTSKRREGKGETVIKGMGRGKKEKGEGKEQRGEGRGKGREGSLGEEVCSRNFQLF